MLIFTRPALLLLLLPAAPAVYLRHFWKGRGGRVPFPAAAADGTVLGRSRAGRAAAAAASVFFWLALAAAAAAAAGPAYVSRETVYLNRGADILFVIDESPSMAAQDIGPGSRFEAAQGLIRSFIEGRKNNYIGLITFGEEASLQVPLTKDYATLLSRLKELGPGRHGDKTAIGLGLGVACAHLQHSTAVKRIIILLTDGENNAGDVSPLQAARIAAAIDSVVYTCGIGRQGETTVEYTEPDTGEIIRGTFTSYYDEILLQDIAEITGGLFFAAPNEETLAEMFRIIDRIETERVETGFVRQKQDKYRLFLLPALLLFTVSCIVRLVLLREPFI